MKVVRKPKKKPWGVAGKGGSATGIQGHTDFTIA